MIDLPSLWLGILNQTIRLNSKLQSARLFHWTLYKTDISEMFLEYTVNIPRISHTSHCSQLLDPGFRVDWTHRLTYVFKKYDALETGRNLNKRLGCGSFLHEEASLTNSLCNCLTTNIHSATLHVFTSRKLTHTNFAPSYPCLVLGLFASPLLF